MLVDVRGRSHGFDLHGADDVAIHRELHVRSRVVRGLRDLRQHDVPVRIIRGLEEQFMVDALHVGDDAAQLVGLETGDISRQVRIAGLDKVAPGPAERVQNKRLLRAPCTARIVDEALERDRKHHGGAAPGHACAHFAAMLSSRSRACRRRRRGQ